MSLTLRVEVAHHVTHYHTSFQWVNMTKGYLCNPKNFAPVASSPSCLLSQSLEMERQSLVLQSYHLLPSAKWPLVTSDPQIYYPDALGERGSLRLTASAHPAAEVLPQPLLLPTHCLTSSMCIHSCLHSAADIF